MRATRQPMTSEMKERAKLGVLTVLDMVMINRRIAEIDWLVTIDKESDGDMDELDEILEYLELSIKVKVNRFKVIKGDL
jgi:hypothetical protein